MNSKNVFGGGGGFYFAVALLGLITANLASGADQTGTKWSGTWKDGRWGDGEATLIITEGSGDSWQAIWRDGGGIRYRSVLEVSEEAGKVTIKGDAKGRIRTISLEGTLKNDVIECTYKGRDCSGTVRVVRQS